jgi:hypothetical protein
LAQIAIDRPKGGDLPLGAIKRPSSSSDVDAIEIIRQDAVSVRRWIRRQNCIIEKNRIARVRHPMMVDMKCIPADA